MSFSSPGFVLAIIAMSYSAWVVVSWIRAKHGYPVENEWGGTCHPAKMGEATNALVAENKHLKQTVGRLEERLKVLERIVTDEPSRLSKDIKALAIEHDGAL